MAGYGAAAATRIGSSHQINQDAALVIPASGARPWLVAVADGVGGANAGEVASRVAVTALDRAWRAAWDARGAPPDITHTLRDACADADAAVRAVATDELTYGAATTLTVATVGASGLIVAQAGDSGVWTYESAAVGLPRRVTPIHTVVEEENAARARRLLPPLTDDEVANHPDRTSITVYLGMPGGCPVHVATVAPGHDLPAVILVCTDGVADTMTATDLGHAARAGTSTDGTSCGGSTARSACPVADAVIRTVDDRRWHDDATIVALVAAPPSGSQRVSSVRTGAAPTATQSGAIIAAVAPPVIADRSDADPYGLRGASRGAHTSGAKTTRRAIAGLGLGMAAIAVGAGGAWLWPTIERLADAFRGSGGVDPLPAARDYLAQLSTGDHAALWLRLASNVRRQVPQDEFVRRHRDFLAELGATRVDGAPIPRPATGPGGLSATVTCDLTYASTRFGELRARVALPFLWEDGAWRLDWSPTVLLPDLAGGRRVHVASDPPLRGTLLDRTGSPLASAPIAPAATVTPALHAEDRPREARALSQTPTPVVTRAYPNGDVAGPLVGYTAEATADELTILADRGYLPGDRVGRAGLERVAEAHLAGARGSRLNVLEPSGIVVTTLATVPPRHGGSVVTTLDLALQRVAEASLGQRIGSVVAIDLPTGAVRAAATWPRYDPTAFEVGRGVAALLDDSRKPLLNRPVQGLYPPGSTFKVVTMAAAMTHGVATPESTFTCTGTWTGLPGVSQRCWLRTGHGTITLADGLTQSCNSVFYELGKRLDALDASLLPAIARQAGLGSVTGAFLGEEPAGVVPDATWKRTNRNEPWTPGDSVNLAIGQGQLLVTPLQLAAVYGMIASGQPITPTVIGAIRLPGGTVEQRLATPTPAPPIRAWAPTALTAMRASLAAVVSGKNGTAVGAFAGSKVASIVAGKTGTAENQPGKPTHAWFAGYGPIGTPTVAVVAMVEQGGEGSGVAAPIARTVLEAALTG